jgi:general secretion pathway protein N
MNSFLLSSRGSGVRTRAQPAMRMSAWAWTGAVAGALLSMLFFAPARWLADAVYQGTSQQLLLADPRGTVWRGSARLVLTGGAGSQDAAALPERVQWTLRPGFTRMHLSVLSECCTAQALQLSIAPRLNGMRMELADGQAHWPASLLAGLGTPWNTLQPKGELILQSRSLSAEWNAGRFQLGGSAVLEAKNFESRLSTLHPLGSYRVRLQGGPAISVTLETIEGGLRLAGSGQFIGQRLHFSGEASAAPEREAALANFLNVIGRRNGPRSIITIG